MKSPKNHYNYYKKTVNQIINNNNQNLFLQINQKDKIISISPPTNDKINAYFLQNEESKNNHQIHSK